MSILIDRDQSKRHLIPDCRALESRTEKPGTAFGPGLWDTPANRGELISPGAKAKVMPKEMAKPGCGVNSRARRPGDVTVHARVLPAGKN